VDATRGTFVFHTQCSINRISVTLYFSLDYVKGLPSSIKSFPEKKKLHTAVLSGKLKLQMEIGFGILNNTNFWDAKSKAIP
jgi:hypothetical protein